MGCVICGTPFAAFREGERHFGRCVARNGNPRGWHVSCFLSSFFRWWCLSCQVGANVIPQWFDNEEFLAHRAKGGKGTQLT